MLLSMDEDVEGGLEIAWSQTSGIYYNLGKLFSWNIYEVTTSGRDSSRGSDHGRG